MQRTLMCIGHISSEAFVGSLITMVHAEDRIEFMIPEHQYNLADKLL